ncbi:MAG: energy-coupling factor transporter ATPase [Clostridiales bacterium]|jgi:cobalt import ATP-binding protein cbiO 1|nr:energy-coupling factor transporter ATPase [Clostridiales bacterium]
MTDFIKFDNVSYTYDDIEEETYQDQKQPVVPQRVNYAVENANFTIKKGEFVAIVGRNGSGKSTLARMMNALLLPTEGTVSVNEIDTSNEEMIWEIRSHIGMVFQNPDNQIIGTSVEEDVAFGLENLGVPRDEMIRRIDWALDIVKMEKERRTEPHLLSGGQKQRCAIAGIIAMQPDCIVLDEATAMLDPIGRREVMALITKLNREQNITIVHITHHMDEVAQADRVILIDRGKIFADTTPRKMFSDVERIRAAGLEVPQITALMHILKQNGLEVPEDVITVEEGIEILSALLQTGGVKSCH